ncbi:PLDc N-terminal domain-containing protein [Spirilliplanes yamanashiensis]|uniref:Cardiolipin synthase N-terminal domain-containing protein n=1 Tax=Spirilliplanes yamanashiensis TaxID=42233 RepID=A0A8J3Y4Q8_9ACTN|nr:PLDc N-terminal domain-containing protein [Spirilliplanes yamanashiensis]MDP9819836.1 hypothetical protein [Spirilliplanes yamanashiensis]GIJ01345.1 hypothetical protein Sya03_06970 [Spirilliplanes yamanashiensis]
MVRVFLLLAAVELVLVALALISCLSAEKRAVRGMPRALWVVVILLLPLLGPVLWFVAGRPRPQEPGGVRRKPPRPASPDDDPDFLRNLDAGSTNRDRELFERWEQDLQRREDEQRRETERRETERREKEGDADEARHREE